MAKKGEDTIETTGTEFKMPTPTEIAGWKQKHGDISLITVKAKDGTEHYAIMRKPGMNDFQIASASERKKAMTYNLSIWNNCKLVADPKIDNDDFLLIGALNQIAELVEVAESSIKKL